MIHRLVAGSLCAGLLLSACTSEPFTASASVPSRRTPLGAAGIELDGAVDIPDSGTGGRDSGTGLPDSGTSCIPEDCGTPPPDGCWSWICNGAGMCEQQNAPSTTRCDDLNPCTGPDRCNGSGACIYDTYNDCSGMPGSDCLSYSCDGDGGCARNYAPTGKTCRDVTTCTDGNCDGNGSCVLGTTSYCTSSLYCPAAIDCTTGACDCNGAGSCIPKRNPDGTPCNLGMGCNFACLDGFCQLSPVSCAPAGCFTYYCDGTTCRQNMPLDAGTPCDDGDPCTLSTSCLADGGCGAGTPKVCPPAGLCTRGFCNPADGGCSAVLLGENAPCGPGDAGHCSGLTCVLPDGGAVGPEPDGGTARVNPFSCGCSSSGAMGAMFVVIALALFSSKAGRRSKESA